MLKEHSTRKLKTNKWFQKAAKILALNSKTNVQKSYWKLSHNVESSGQVLNANMVAKIKKIFSIMKRHMDISKLRSFYHILNIDKTEFDLDASKIVDQRLKKSNISNSYARDSVR